MRENSRTHPRSQNLPVPLHDARVLGHFVDRTARLTSSQPAAMTDPPLARHGAAVSEQPMATNAPPIEVVLCTAFTAALLWSGAARAHIHLLEPIPRYPDQVANENKSCPCGVGRSNRICQFEEDYSDPDRSLDRVTTFEAGSTVTVVWDEYFAHAGRYRVAFDEDGADIFDFNEQPLIDIPDPRGRAGNTGDGSIWEVDVTLPNTLCENCTLQLIQVMDGETEAPVDNPIGRSTYYQCADIRIVADLPDPPDAACSTAPGLARRGSSAAASGIGALALLGLAGWSRRCSGAHAQRSRR